MRTSPYPNRNTDSRRWALLKPEARRMRHNSTEAEAAFWEQVRRSKLGTRFRRQHAIDWYIVDFVCFPERLVVEVDGEAHLGREREDGESDSVLRSLGFSVVRFPNRDVLTNMDCVVLELRRQLEMARTSRSSSSPSPLGEGVGG